MIFGKKERTRFEQFVNNARPDDEQKVLAGYSSARDKAAKRGAGHKLLEQVGLLWTLLWDPDYELSWMVKAWALAALAYFICPADLIPDVIPGAGYADDLAVVSWVCTVIADEIAAYQRWKEGRKNRA